MVGSKVSMRLALCNFRLELCYCDISADALETRSSAMVVEACGGISRSGT